MRILGTPWAAKEVLEALEHQEQEQPEAGGSGVQEKKEKVVAPSSFSNSTTTPPMKLLSLSLTADLSHWVLAAERMFDSFPSDAEWWPGLLEKVAKNTMLTHARVGSPREIQVNSLLGAYILDHRDQTPYMM
jgi:hypothetical protein